MGRGADARGSRRAQQSRDKPGDTADDNRPFGETIVHARASSPGSGEERSQRPFHVAEQVESERREMILYAHERALKELNYRHKLYDYLLGKCGWAELQAVKDEWFQTLPRLSRIEEERELNDLMQQNTETLRERNASLRGYMRRNGTGRPVLK